MADIFDVSIERKESGTHNPKNSFEFPISFHVYRSATLPSVFGDEIHYVVACAQTSPVAFIALSCAR